MTLLLRTDGTRSYIGRGSVMAFRLKVIHKIDYLLTFLLMELSIHPLNNNLRVPCRENKSSRLDGRMIVSQYVTHP